MKKRLSLIISLGFLSLSLSVRAESLIDVYNQAVSNNPELRQVNAQRQMAYAVVKDSMGSLLPQIGFSGNVGKSYGTHAANGSDNTTRGLNLALNQVLFNFSTWKQLTIAEKQAAIADVSYKAQEQSLMLDTASAYFEILKNIDILLALQAQKKAIKTQLEQTTQRYNVGLIPVMDVQNAQAQYDQTTAQEVLAKNDLDNALESLRQITGKYYTELATVTETLGSEPLNYNINELLERANSSSLSLIISRMSLDLANEQIKLAKAARLPIVALTAGKTLSKNSINTSNGTSSSISNEAYDRTTGADSINASLSVPLYTGGSLTAKTKQAQYNYDSYQHELEATNRQVEKDVRSAYNNINASISAIKAYEQTVKSAESALSATRASYSVGTRTIVDVLNATTALYDAKRYLSSAKFNYLISILSLKGALGELERADLVYLDQMLNSVVLTSYDVTE